MFKRFRFFVLYMAVAGCVEPYEFVVKDASPSLVIEAYISDKSYNETLSYPSDGRHFTVKLTETGDVTNVRPNAVTGASVELMSSENQHWSYQEGSGGIYTLFDDVFEAKRGIQYKMRIALQNEDIYESDWQAMPDTDVPPMGAIGFRESEKQVYVMESGKWVLRTKQIGVGEIELPDNTSGQAIYYRWNFVPMWIYVAPLISQVSPVYRCWATDQNYLNNYALQIDKSGGYRKDLFDFLTIRNERIFEKFSVLVIQQTLTEDYYNFWKEMKEQNEGSALIDTPPYNLKTNFSSPTGAKRASGYFGVTAEEAKRWYFDRTQLSYHVENTLRADCLVVYGPGPPAEECTDCRAYSFGKAVNVKPAWWPY
jgi:hypothetical protein